MKKMSCIKTRDLADIRGILMRVGIHCGSEVHNGAAMKASQPWGSKVTVAYFAPRANIPKDNDIETCVYAYNVCLNYVDWGDEIPPV